MNLFDCKLSLFGVLLCVGSLSVGGCDLAGASGQTVERDGAARVSFRDRSYIEFDPLEAQLLGSNREAAFNLKDQANSLIAAIKAKPYGVVASRNLKQLLEVGRRGCLLDPSAGRRTLGAPVLSYFMDFHISTLSDEQLLDAPFPVSFPRNCFSSEFAKHFGSEPEYLFSNRFTFRDVNIGHSNNIARFWEVRGRADLAASYHYRAILDDVDGLDCSKHSTSCWTELWGECKSKLASNLICDIDSIPRTARVNSEKMSR